MSATRFARALPAGRTHLDQLAGPLAALYAETDRLDRWGRELARVLTAGGRLLAAGNGGSAHLAGALLATLTGANLVHVPYKTQVPAAVATSTGEVDLSFIAIATANRILMLEHAIYSVISPEGAASIIWRDSNKKEEAATNMKITAQDLDQLGVIDGIIKEPVGGAHRDRESVIIATGNAVARMLAEFDGKSAEEIRKQRHERFLSIGR